MEGKCENGGEKIEGKRWRGKMWRGKDGKENKGGK